MSLLHICWPILGRLSGIISTEVLEAIILDAGVEVGEWLGEGSGFIETLDE